MTTINETLEHAADLLDQDARALFDCHTVAGVWDLAEQIDADTYAVYCDLVKTANALRAIIRSRPAMQDELRRAR